MADKDKAANDVSAFAPSLTSRAAEVGAQAKHNACYGTYSQSKHGDDSSSTRSHVNKFKLGIPTLIWVLIVIACLCFLSLLSSLNKTINTLDGLIEIEQNRQIQDEYIKFNKHLDQASGSSKKVSHKHKANEQNQQLQSSPMTMASDADIIEAIISDELSKHQPSAQSWLELPEYLALDRPSSELPGPFKAFLDSLPPLLDARNSEDPDLILIAQADDGLGPMVRRPPMFVQPAKGPEHSGFSSPINIDKINIDIHNHRENAARADAARKAKHAHHAHAHSHAHAPIPTPQPSPDAALDAIMRELLPAMVDELPIGIPMAPANGESNRMPARPVPDPAARVDLPMFGRPNEMRPMPDEVQRIVMSIGPIMAEPPKALHEASSRQKPHDPHHVHHHNKPSRTAQAPASPYELMDELLSTAGAPAPMPMPLPLPMLLEPANNDIAARRAKHHSHHKHHTQEAQIVSPPSDDQLNRMADELTESLLGELMAGDLENFENNLNKLSGEKPSPPKKVHQGDDAETILIINGEPVLLGAPKDANSNQDKPGDVMSMLFSAMSEDADEKMPPKKKGGKPSDVKEKTTVSPKTDKPAIDATKKPASDGIFDDVVSVLYTLPQMSAGEQAPTKVSPQEGAAAGGSSAAQNSGGGAPSTGRSGEKMICDCHKAPANASASASGPSAARPGGPPPGAASGGGGPSASGGGGSGGPPPPTGGSSPSGGAARPPAGGSSPPGSAGQGSAPRPPAGSGTPGAGGAAPSAASGGSRPPAGGGAAGGSPPPPAAATGGASSPSPIGYVAVPNRPGTPNAFAVADQPMQTAGQSSGGSPAQAIPQLAGNLIQTFNNATGNVLPRIIQRLNSTLLANNPALNATPLGPLIQQVGKVLSGGSSGGAPAAGGGAAAAKPPAAGAKPS